MRKATPLVFVLVAGALVAVDGDTVAGMGQRLQTGVGRLRGAEGATLAQAQAVASTLATAQAALSHSTRPPVPPAPTADAPSDPDWGNLPDDAEGDEQADALDDA